MKNIFTYSVNNTLGMTFKMKQSQMKVNEGEQSLMKANEGE